ncbi:hypothetical protein Bca4012_099810 [Brassica carinata]
MDGSGLPQVLQALPKRVNIRFFSQLLSCPGLDQDNKLPIPSYSHVSGQDLDVLDNPDSETLSMKFSSKRMLANFTSRWMIALGESVWIYIVQASSCTNTYLKLLSPAQPWAIQVMHNDPLFVLTAMPD